MPEDFAAWAANKGVVLSGVEPKQIPGRGIGLVTTRQIKVSSASKYTQVTEINTDFTRRPERPSYRCPSPRSSRRVVCPKTS